MSRRRSRMLNATSLAVLSVALTPKLGLTLAPDGIARLQGGPDDETGSSQSTV